MTPDQLKAWRARLSLTQAQAADLLGVHPNHYSLMEQGKRGIRRVMALACAELERRHSCAR